MSSVIDSFMVKLGLDGSAFREGTDEAIRDRNRLADASKRQDIDQINRERRMESEQAKRARDQEARAKAMADGLRKVRNEALSLFGLFTAGVGMKNFISNTIESAVRLHYLRQNLAMGVESLQAYGRAAERMGGSTEGMFNQLKESADALAQLRSGMGPNEGMQWFFRMGGSSDDLQDGNKYLMARAKIIHDMFQVDPTRARLISKNMGIGDDMFDVIKQGPEVFQKMADAQRKNSAITAADAAGAVALKEKWLDFTQALTATTTKIVVALIPAFSQLMNWIQTLAEKITNNKDAIGKWVTEFVAKAIPVMQKFGKFLADLDWDGAANRLKTVGDAIVKIADALSQVIDLWNEWIGKKGTPGKIGVSVQKAIDPKGALADYYGADEVAKDNMRKRAGQESKYSAVDYFIKRMEARVGNQAAKEFIRDSTGVDEFNAGPRAAPVAPVMPGQANATFSRLEKQYGLSAGTLDAMWFKESSRGKNMLSPAGAQGHFGFMPKTQKEYGLRDPNNLDESADAAARKMKNLLRMYNGDYEKALSAYNWGEGNLQRGGLSGRPAETRNYARDIMGRIGASAAPAARGGPQSSTSTTDVKVGTVNIQTQATDAKGIAMAIGPAMREYSFSDQANTGFV